MLYRLCMVGNRFSTLVHAGQPYNPTQSPWNQVICAKENFILLFPLDRVGLMCVHIGGVSPSLPDVMHWLVPVIQIPREEVLTFPDLQIVEVVDTRVLSLRLQCCLMAGIDFLYRECWWRTDDWTAAKESLGTVYISQKRDDPNCSVTGVFSENGLFLSKGLVCFTSVVRFKILLAAKLSSMQNRCFRFWWMSSPALAAIMFQRF